MFAALNTMEPPILELTMANILEGDRPWNDERIPLLEDRVRARLDLLSAYLTKTIGWTVVSRRAIF
jgi:glutathione S-transferase